MIPRQRKKVPPEKGSLKLTTANQIPIIRISTGSYLCPGPTFLRLDDDDRPLFPFVLRVPYPKIGKMKVSDGDQLSPQQGERIKVQYTQPGIRNFGRIVAVVRA